VTVGGADRYSHEGRRAHSLGYLSHDSMLYDDLTAAENLRFHARLHDVDPARVTALLETVDLHDRANGFPREFSHGMRKRLSLARALLADPEVLLLDEPFTGLDQHSTEMLERLIADRTVVLVTHAPELSTALCDRFVVLDQGRVVARIDEEIATPAAFRETYRAVLSS
jgi:heme exporter protein A